MASSTSSPTSLGLKPSNSDLRGQRRQGSTSSGEQSSSPFTLDLQGRFPAPPAHAPGQTPHSPPTEALDRLLRKLIETDDTLLASRAASSVDEQEHLTEPSQDSYASQLSTLAVGSSPCTSSSSTNLLTSSPRTSLAESRKPATRVLKHRSSTRSVQAAAALAPPGPPPSTALPQVPLGPPPSTALPQVPGAPFRRTPPRDYGLTVPSPGRVRSLSHSSSTPVLKNRVYGPSHSGLNLSPPFWREPDILRAGPPSPSTESSSHVHLPRTLQKRPSASGLSTSHTRPPFTRSDSQDGTNLVPNLRTTNNVPGPSPQPQSQSLSPPPLPPSPPPPQLKAFKSGIDLNQRHAVSAPVVPSKAREVEVTMGTTKSLGLHQAPSGLPTTSDSVPVRSLLDEVQDEGAGGSEMVRTKSSLRFSKLRSFSDRFQLRRRAVPEPAPSPTQKPPSTRTAGSA